MTEPAFTFTAFISYKRGGEDERWAKWLQRRLEAFRIPTALASDTPRRLKVFRDKTDLGSHAALNEALTKSLDTCRSLIVVCSPRGAASPYVADEVRHFQATGRADNIIPFIIEGTPAPREGEEQCYPPPLDATALGITLSEGSREEALIRVVARLLGVDFHTLYQRHLRAQRRFMLWVAAALSAVVLVVSGLALWAYNAEQRATAQRLEAEDLVNFLSWDLRVEILRYMPLRVQHDILGKVADYHEKWNTQTVDARNLRAQHSRNEAITAINKADWPQYERHMAQALDILTALHDEVPDNSDIHSSLWSLHREHARTLHQKDGLTDTVLRHTKAAQALLNSFLQKYDDPVTTLLRLSENTQYEITFQELAGKADNAYALAQDAVQMWEAAAQKNLDIPYLDRHYGAALDTLCQVSTTSEQVFANCAKSLRHLQKRIARDPTNQRLQQNRIFTLVTLFTLDPAQAEKLSGINLDDLQAQAQKQYAYDPENLEYALQLGQVMLIQAMRARATGASKQDVLTRLDECVRLLGLVAKQEAKHASSAKLLKAARAWQAKLRPAPHNTALPPPGKEGP